MSEVMNFQVGLDRLNQLREYYELENSEISELCQILDAAWMYQDYMLSDNFKNALAEEILAQLDNFKEYCVIEEETVTPEPYTRKYLEWN